MFNAMTTRANRRIRQKAATGREPAAITASVVVLGVLVLIRLGMLSRRSGQLLSRSGSSARAGRNAACLRTRRLGRLVMRN